MLDKRSTAKVTAHSPLDLVAEHAMRVSQICDLLEALADDLPRRSAPVWREAIQMCNSVIPKHYQDVVRVLVPILQKRTQGEMDCEDLLSRLRSDFEDEARNLPELNDLLTEGIGTDRIDPEALGYALRGFFSGLRRNGLWETEVLLPLASRRLLSDDLDKLAGILMPNASEVLT